MSSRTLGAYTSVASEPVTLDDATGDATVVHFTVPAGQARLDASVAYPPAGNSSNDFNAASNLSLISPRHKLAEYNLPQGAGGLADAQVADPTPGTWTALIYGSPSDAGGTVGTFPFGASVAPWAPFGTLSTSSLSLAPGASAPVTLTVPTPSRAGDQAGSIVFSQSGGGGLHRRHHRAGDPAGAGAHAVPVDHFQGHVDRGQRPANRQRGDRVLPGGHPGRSAGAERRHLHR